MRRPAAGCGWTSGCDDQRLGRGALAGDDAAAGAGAGAHTADGTGWQVDVDFTIRGAAVVEISLRFYPFHMANAACSCAATVPRGMPTPHDGIVGNAQPRLLPAVLLGTGSATRTGCRWRRWRRLRLDGGGVDGGECFHRVDWVAVPKAVRARRINRWRLGWSFRGLPGSGEGAQLTRASPAQLTGRALGR
jgi:hypothetical protein